MKKFTTKTTLGAFGVIAAAALAIGAAAPAMASTSDYNGSASGAVHISSTSWSQPSSERHFIFKDFGTSSSNDRTNGTFLKDLGNGSSRNVTGGNVDGGNIAGNDTSAGNVSNESPVVIAPQTQVGDIGGGSILEGGILNGSGNGNNVASGNQTQAPVASGNDVTAPVEAPVASGNDSNVGNDAVLNNDGVRANSSGNDSALGNILGNSSDTNSQSTFDGSLTSGLGLGSLFGR